MTLTDIEGHLSNLKPLGIQYMGMQRIHYIH